MLCYIVLRTSVVAVICMCKLAGVAYDDAVTHLCGHCSAELWWSHVASATMRAMVQVYSNVLTVVVACIALYNTVALLIYTVNVAAVCMLLANYSVQIACFTLPLLLGHRCQRR
jgi:hypothetical protein